MNILQQNALSKPRYEVPKIEMVQFFCVDIITTSGMGDENQGEWDPQSMDDPLW